MIYLEGAMHKKINWWIAALVILIITISAAYAISAKAARYAWYFGGQITKVQQAKTCGCPKEPPCSNGCPCGYSDVTIRPFGGGQTYVCVPSTFLVKGKGLLQGLKIIGGGQSSLSPEWIWTVN
ncbi:MAG: hypothetical protein A3J62_02115 [Candidatus Buchananbacteria bacterium RIFCSPHIGHO2_02_FULL_38_8]|uniref:Uncharacterized protein n=2 Tax=Candidatus Buchananiibacteriota TaxID=1817903 RepID=A0A1G1XVH2_9BACT|nr:MAG: hypothetical protein A2731_02600 [Candidatus Buchananbacteria bacterium RIFCSPHIGHO2_01_FULL_39_8]OGY47884.1 MAG: hypothetical protein A3J62_02115 [Candidatus Buchananbacteria bacterium RIFCSPHIGHO2_02_FULL_38_8]